MPGANDVIANYINVLTATQERIQSGVADIWHKDHAFLFFLRMMGGVKMYEGGRAIHVNRNTTKDPTVASRGEWDQVPLQDVEHLDRAEYLAKFITGAVTLNEFQMSENRGKEKVLSIIEERVRNFRLSMEDELNFDLMNSDGSNPLKVSGLKHAIPDDPTTGTFGGINRATDTDWRPQQVSGGAFSSQGIDDMYTLNTRVNTSSRIRRSSLILMTDVLYNAYAKTELGRVRYAGPLAEEAADAGIRVLDFLGIPVIWDDAAPDGNTYFMNFDNLFLKVNTDWNFKLARPIESDDVFAVSQKGAHMSQLCSDNPRYLGVITGQTA